MDRLDYLNQLASEVRPEKKTKLHFLKSPIVKVLLGGVIAFIVIAIIGSIISASQPKILASSVALKYHVDNTLEVITKYQPSVKSSDLRSSSASLSSVLSNTSRELTDYLAEVAPDYKTSTFQNEIEEANLNRDGLEAALFDAKINGILDKVYVSKVVYEISLIMSEEADIYRKTGDAALRSILETSYNSLGNLLDNFNGA